MRSVKKTDNVAIALTLGSIGDPRAVEVLRDLIAEDSVDSYVRETAQSALPRLEQMMSAREAKGSGRSA